MRIFLAGATGVIGRPLVPALLAAGHQVTAITRRPDRASALRAHEVDAVVGDVFDAPGLAAAVAAAAPDVVLHQLTDLADGDRERNAALRITGTRNLVDAARAAGVRRMVAQSIAWAYAPGADVTAPDAALDVDSPDETRRATVRAVAALESAVHELPEWVVLRYGMLHGPGTWYPDGIPADTPAGTPWLSVANAVTAAITALTSPTGPHHLVDPDLPAR